MVEYEESGVTPPTPPEGEDPSNWDIKLWLIAGMVTLLVLRDYGYFM